jgi:hypothetical protein
MGGIIHAASTAPESAFTTVRPLDDGHRHLHSCKGLSVGSHVRGWMPNLVLASLLWMINQLLYRFESTKPTAALKTYLRARLSAYHESYAHKRVGF